MLKEKTKINKIGSSKFVLIPSTIRDDSQFPFSDDEELVMEIRGNKLIIRGGDLNDSE